MCESDSDTSDLNIESNSFEKLRKRMKTLGFQEGVAQGREISLQRGFDLGYQDGFKIGEQMGLARGKKTFLDALENKLPSNEPQIGAIAKEICYTCCKGNTEENYQSFGDFMLEQKKFNEKINKSLQNSNFLLLNK